MTYNLVQLNKMNSKELKTLYNDAFPRNERKPIMLINRLISSGHGILYGAYRNDDNAFVGFAFVLINNNLALIDYIAVSSAIRGGGVGSFMLDALSKELASYTICLEIEAIEKSADNLEQRTKRRQFYLKNNYLPTEIFVCIYHCNMELLYVGQSITFDDYHALLTATLGSRIVGFLKPQRINKPE